ncbi:MAG: EF-P beta-lysylation protein EpmB [Gammaproteobacteria bacterium]|nr:EF-P beta-lysylation protein EpmB [Gammaproteobacteria bacterium]
MIPRTLPQDTDWKTELRQAVTKPEELLELLELPKSRWLNSARQAALQFPLKVPRGFIQRMEKGDAADPLLRQILPLANELQKTEGYNKDPVGDGTSTPVPGLIHKYRSRALLISTGACAVHCRYCFRRHFPYQSSHAGGSQLEEIRQYLHTHNELNEVILSGGDPLMLDDRQLARLLQTISAIPHIRWIRIHSRLPIVLPERVTEKLLETLSGYKPVTLVIHCNHPNELDSSVNTALRSLHQFDIRLYNQSVLLRGVNNQVETLCELSHQLYAARVQPYYLHCLDRVDGAAHFDLSDHEIETLYHQVQAQLSGFLVPKLVRELQGKPSKSLIV